MSSVYLLSLYMKKKIKIVLYNPKQKFILSSQEKRQGPLFKVSHARVSLGIDILIWSPIPTLIELDNA